MLTPSLPPVGPQWQPGKPTPSSFAAAQPESVASGAPHAVGRFFAARQRGRHTLSLTHDGSPLSCASTESTTPTHSFDSSSTLGSTTEEEDSPGANPEEQVVPPAEVREIAPPPPGAHVTRDPEHPYMPTPVRGQVTTTTPADQGKKQGESAGHPFNLH